MRCREYRPRRPTSWCCAARCRSHACVVVRVHASKACRPSSGAASRDDDDDDGDDDGGDGDGDGPSSMPGREPQGGLGAYGEP